MRVRVTMPARVLEASRERLARSGAEFWLPTALARSSEQIEFLLPAPRDADPLLASARVALAPPGIGLTSHWHWHAVGSPDRAAGTHLELLLGRERGCSAAAFVGGRLLRVDEVALPGPRMERWSPGRPPPELVGTVPADGRHSRYIGALGGHERHLRLRRLRCLGIGAGRLNSALCIALSKAGADTVLVDPDHLEAHSEDAVECSPSTTDATRRHDVLHKVEAVARFGAMTAPWAKITPLATTADAPAALEAARTCDLVFSAPDRDSARFAAALLAVALHRVHLDLGTGVFEGPEVGDWRAGADIRLMLPGDGCLLCHGGLDLRHQPPADWRRQRAGSLRSLNHLASSSAMLLLERLVVGDLRESTWLRIEVARDGVPSVRGLPTRTVGNCPCCGSWAGSGDRAFAPR